MHCFLSCCLVTLRSGKRIDSSTAKDVSKQCSTLRGGKHDGSVRSKDVRKKQKNSTQDQCIYLQELYFICNISSNDSETTNSGIFMRELLVKAKKAASSLWTVLHAQS
jgi:hypothetical protein